MILTVDEFLGRFGTLHDAVVTRTQITYARRSETTVIVEVVGRDETVGDAFENPDWRQVTFTMRACKEMRITQQWPHDNAVILQAHVQHDDDGYWVVLDASLVDDGVDLSPDECRQSSFYFRAESLEIDDGGPSTVPRE